jgi:putative transposase
LRRRPDKHYASVSRNGEAPMSRLGRYFLRDQPQHIIQRGNNRAAIFFNPEDYALYRRWLGEAAVAHGCAIYAYVLMTNHVHILAAPRDPGSIPRTLQSLGRRYVAHINRRDGRSGTLWEGRYRATAIDTDAYFLACCRYIELNPVRAGIVRHPREYRWSSWRQHASGASDPLLTEHALYGALGTTPAERQSSYRALFRTALDPDFVAALRRATNTGWALGAPEFQSRLAEATGRRTAPRPPGRPRKERASRESGEETPL